MKKSILFLMITFLVACQNDSNTNEMTSTDEPVVTDTSSSNPAAEKVSSNALEGMYVGYFQSKKTNDQENASYSNKINIVIEKIENKNISGHTVVAGNLRPFSGTINSENYAEVSEPGDDKYDGEFMFTCYPALEEITGTWIANDSKLAVSERFFTLKKTTFSYNEDLLIAEITGDENDDYPYAHLTENQNDIGLEVEAITWDAIRINASNKILKKEDIENLYKGDLEIIRNTVYARHGYSFKNRKMRYFFDSYVDWYVPVSIDVRSALTEIEKKNDELLKRYEEHAESYYDYFGR